MAFTTVVGGFELAGAIGTYLGLGQNHINSNKARSFCKITASLSITRDNLLHALGDVINFADILTEDESKLVKASCDGVSIALKEQDEIPIAKKKLNYFRKNPEYSKQLKRVRNLEERSHQLIVIVKETSSDAAIREAQRKKLEKQDRKARKARRDFLEDIIYYKKMQQLLSRNDSHDSTINLFLKEARLKL
ncbi:hypothetical protein C0995_012424 [Termitomyces sp. Mi166|nr:hypothetical protein C0995_012424 [Termitomyces sp. Mi166\